jgi:hypothetical protein
MSSEISALRAKHVLPPLILHPFTDAAGSSQVLQSAKSAAEALLDGDETVSQAEQLRQRLLAGRYAEFRMLFFVGKDVFRWLGQCMDYGRREDSLKARNLVEQSFAEFLIARTPADVESKLRRWGVADFTRIFGRAIGIHVQFSEPPPQELLSAEYLQRYFRFADYAYTCWKDSAQFPVLSAGEFSFSLYASGEYSRILEEQWNGQPEA